MGKTIGKRAKNLNRLHQSSFLLQARAIFVRLAPMIGIIAVWFVFAKPYFLNGLIPFPSRYLVSFFPPWQNYQGMAYHNGAMPDIITQLFPWKKAVIDSWKAGMIPWWNPYQFSGNPLAANMQSAAFTPFNLLFSLFSFVDGWSLFILLQPLCAGYFMFLYLRTLRLSASAALFGALSFMFCGFITVWMAYGTLGYAFLYLPLLLFTIEKIIHRPNLWFSLLLPISVVFSVVSGHMQTSLYVIGCGFVYLLFQVGMTRQIRAFFWGVAGFATGILISLIQILPTAELYRESVRSVLFQKGEIIPIQYLITFIAPDFFGNPVTRNDWFGHYAEWAGFAGVVPFLFASLAVFTIRKNKHVLFFTTLFVFSILTAYGSGLSDVIVNLHIPVISTSSFSRIIALASFAVAVLGAIGFDEWSERKRFNKKTIILLCVGFGVIVAGIWIMLSTGKVMGLTHQEGFDVVHIARRNFVLPTMLVGITAVVLIGSTLAQARFLKIGMVILIVLTAFDMYRFASKWMPFEEKRYVYPNLPVLFHLEENAAQMRVLSTMGNEAFTVFKLTGIEGYDPLYISRYGRFVRAADYGMAEEAERSVVKLVRSGTYAKKLIDFLGVGYIVHSTGDGRNLWTFPFWQYPESFHEPVWSDDTYEIYKNESAYQRAFMVHEVIEVPGEDRAIETFYSSSFDPKTTVILSDEFSDNPSTVCAEIHTDRVVFISYQPNTIVLSVDTGCDGFLVLTDAFYPGWKAVVDGKIAQIHQADVAFRAVFVPQGTHTIQFKYAYRYF